MLPIFLETEVNMGQGVWRLKNDILPEKKSKKERPPKNWTIENYDVSNQDLCDFLRKISIRKTRLETKYKQVLESQIVRLSISNQKRIELESQIQKMEKMIDNF